MRFLKGIIISFVMLGILLGFSFESLAVPKLQLYIPGATYDTTTETWIIESYKYELWITGANVTIEDVRFAAAVPTHEVGSIEVTWLDNGYYTEDPTDPYYNNIPGLPDYANSVNAYDSDHYIKIDGEDHFTLTFSNSNTDPYVRVGEEYDYDKYLAKIKIPYDPDNPLIDPDPTICGYAENDTPVFGDGSDIPDHGVFSTDFYEYYIGDFNEDYFDTVYNYDPAEYDPVTETFLSTTQGMTKKFAIKVNGYTWVDLVAYDHYLSNNTMFVKSPFSHDCESSTPIPEPATLFLLGTGLIGLAGFGRKKIKKHKSLDI